MTVLQVTWSSGGTKRCDARCHNATHPECDCICKGRYHGKQEGGLAFQAALLQHQEELLLELGTLERSGVLWLDGYRHHPHSALQRRWKDKPRTYQEPLFQD